MSLSYIQAKKEDADLLIKLYDLSFYEDYVKYGECPAYGRSREEMEASIENFPKLIIYYDAIPIGAFSVAKKGNGEYYLGCLCVIPEYQGRGIGSQTIRYMLDYYSDWNKVTLVTPADKLQNINFYTKKCGFRIDGSELDGNVEVLRFVMERK